MNEQEHHHAVIHSHRPMAMLILGGFVAFGLIGAGCLLAKGLRDMKLADRSVTVRGVAEKDVAADLALWDIKFQTSGDELVATQIDSEVQKNKLYAFLAREGITEDAIRLSSIDARDLQTESYSSNPAKKRYTILVRVLVRSRDVAAVDAASRKVGELLKTGVTLTESSYCGSSPVYSYSKLNDIKPAMLAEATASARKAAEQFAADSGSQVGKIRNATQGYFSIVDRDNIDATSENGGGCSPSTPDKKVRVVTTIDYMLD